MSRTIAYLRVSTEDQAQSGLGIDAQLEAIKARIGMPDVIIKDEGQSGDTLDRPGLAELLETAGKGDMIVVAKLDRLSRGDMFAAAWLEKEIVEKRKASILSAAGEGTGDDTPQGRLMRDIIKAFASFELAMIRQRTSAAVKVKMERKRLAGEKTGGKHAPFGYDIVVVNGVKKLAENAQEQAAIKTIVTMRTAGDTLQTIADRLEADGIAPRGGGKWTPKVVRAIIMRAVPGGGQRRNDDKAA
ncbi:MAG: recombinase family protein [Planctomycetaceae bacterium]|nr:recombinase family protein [Planctomycetaceae bacterium]